MEFTSGSSARGQMDRRLQQDLDQSHGNDAAICIHTLFEAQVVRRPDKVAVVFGGRELSYQELNAQANGLAYYLQDLGVGAEAIVGICLECSLDPAVGRPRPPLVQPESRRPYPTYPKDRVAFMLEDAKPAVLVTQSSLQDSMPTGGASLILLDAPDWQGGVRANENPARAAKADNLAYVIYTSGSTGTPKGTLVTHRNVVRSFQSTELWFEFGPDDVWTIFHSFAFDFSVWKLWGALFYGGRAVIVPDHIAKSPEAFYDVLSREQVSVLGQTPSAFYQLLEVERLCPPDKLSHLRFVILGGEALEFPRLTGWFERHGNRTRLINIYGITETTVHVTYFPISSADLDVGSVIGVPIPDLTLHILDDDLEPLPAGEVGEMYVGGAGVACGYLNRSELTAERFIRDPLADRSDARFYRTGDRGRVLADGNIEYHGRFDNQVKLRGYRIELGEIDGRALHRQGLRAHDLRSGSESGSLDGREQTFHRPHHPAHLAKLMTTDCRSLTRDNEVLVVGVRDAEIMELLREEVRSDQMILDLVNIPNREALACTYHGVR
uniref:Amino acid adenylation protein n=1 Tax=uncultured bacterium 14-4D TaxID=1497525 RepID=A0A059U0F2_9BACT|nr:amino acid adenylation protein [uncultured bacterium 14-4D]